VAPLARRRFDDEDDLYDSDGNGPYDKRYPGRRVIADKGRVTVPILLTDGMPNWMPPRRALYDARHYYPPRTYVGDSAALRDAERKAVEARDAWVRGLGDAWRTPGAMQSPPDNGDPDGDEDDGETLSPRDEYIRRTSNMWRTPMASPYGNGSVANAIQNAFIRRVSPGGAVPGDEPAAIEAARRSRGSATPRGVTMGAHNPAKFPSRDAAALKDARADADRAYGEMVNRLENAWRR
jgi:hypothetical protein